MTEGYRLPELTGQERERLQRVHDDLLALAGCDVPSVNAAARAALAQVAQAMNGQALAYELYTSSLPPPPK